VSSNDTSTTFTETIVPSPVSIALSVPRPPARSKQRKIVARGTVRFGAKGLLSSRVSGRRTMPVANATSSAIDSRGFSQEVDERSGLKLYLASGMAVVAVQSTGEFRAARDALLARRHGPRDKGAIVLPPNVRYHVNPVVMRSLADAGIVVVRTERSDVDQGAIEYMLAFLSHRDHSSRSVAAFMKR
jgi:hypothetical protein